MERVGGYVADGVSQSVPSEVAIASKYFAARVALVGLVVGVGEQVGFQIAALVEAASADGAFVRRFFGVQDFVHG